MFNESPWLGLEFGKTDARRVDASARWNWFWMVMSNGDPALVLELSDNIKKIPILPKLRSLDIRLEANTNRAYFIIRLKDKSQLAIFETLCRDVVGSSELGETEEVALNLSINRTFRWHRLLRGSGYNILNEEEQKGLIGEIEVLKLLIDIIGIKSSIIAWTGPSGAPKDFELLNRCIEVKARRSAAQPFIKISNEFQLASVEGRYLSLCVIGVDQVKEPYGFTLTEYVDEITSLIQKNAPSCLINWEQHLADAGYDVSHDYSSWKWTTSTPVFFDVSDDFPRISYPVPLGVEKVTYNLSLSACSPFIVDWEKIKSDLIGSVIE